jgi:hypothetical protein
MSDAASEMKAFYDHYIERFNSGDEAGANACYAYPWNLVTDSKVIAMASPDSGKGLFTALYDRLRPLGWTATEIDKVDAYPAGTNGGLLRVDYRRVRGDGSVIETGRACYMVERTDGRWHFVGCVDSFVGETSWGERPPPRVSHRAGYPAALL